MALEFDITGLTKGLKGLQTKMDSITKKSLDTITDEVMRLSAREVPHDIGSLQNSLGKEPDGEHGIIVGYNKVYAARLHEHPEYHFQKGRKGKYLIDPILNNLIIFKNYMKQALDQGLV